MRLDQVSGWELLAVQVVALLVVATLLWAAGLVFQRSRTGRRLILALAAVAGGLTAAGTLNADEAVVSSYLFAGVLFALGTLAMSMLLLAAIPQTRAAAIGGFAAGGVLLVSFILTYYALFTFGQPRWFRTPG